MNKAIERSLVNKKLTTGFVITLLLLVVLSLAAYRAIYDVREAHRWEIHTWEMIDKVDDILEELTVSEDRLALYLITGKEQDLQQYQKAAATLGPDIVRLERLTANEVVGQQIDSLSRHIHLRIAEMDHLAKIRGQYGLDSVRASIALNQYDTTSYSDECKYWLKKILQTEEDLLSVRKKVSVNNLAKAFGIIAASALIAAGYLVFLYLLIGRTLSARYTALEELELSEHKFHNAFEYSGTGMAIVSPEGKWVDINPPLSELVGYSKEELLRTTFQEITHPEDLNADLELLRRLRRKEISTYSLEKRYIHKKGFPVWIMLTVSAIWNSDGSLRFYIAQIQDISATKKLISELELKNKTLSLTSSQLKEELAQLEEFNRIVAHNLRGPSASVLNITEMIRNEELQEEKDELLELLHESAKALISTLNDLMEVLSVKLNNHMIREICNLAQITDAARAMLQAEILRSGAVISTRFEIPEIPFSRIYLESIFYNMISNSLKYSRPGVKPEISISSARVNDRVQICFSDNGLGIDLEKYGREVFKYNKTFHHGYDSKGVGLFITKNQIEAMGGSISIESRPGDGTTFRIALMPVAHYETLSSRSRS